jgi:RNA polymerase sigma-70 factor, ECF subfamily
MLNEYSPEPAGIPLPSLAPSRAQGRQKFRSSAPDLVARAARGDSQAVARLLEEQRSRIVALARFFTGRSEDAEDLAQDILLRVVQALPTLGSAETFDVWIYRLSRNRCVDHFRRRRLEAGWPPAGEPDRVMWRSTPVPADAALEASDAARRLRQAIRSLPRVWRTAIVLRDLEDLPYEEVASRLRVPVGTVKSRINRGRTRLAAALADAPIRTTSPARA